MFDLLVGFLGVICFLELLSGLSFLFRNRKFIFAQHIGRRVGGRGHFFNPRARKYQKHGNLFFRLVASILGLLVCGFLLNFGSNFGTFWFSVAGSKNVGIVALIELLSELGQGFCRVAYDNDLTLLTDNIRCDAESYLRLGIGTAIGIIIFVYAMVKLRIYVIFNNFQ